MNGSNFSGGEPKSYNLGRGIVFFGGDQPAGYAPGWRDVGNCPELAISFESETKEHLNFLDDIKVVDQEILISQKMSVAFTLEEANFNNLALSLLGFKGGTPSTGTPLLNPSILASDNALFLLANVYIEGILLGTWYDLEMIPAAISSEKRRAYDFEPQQIRSGVTKDVRLNPTNRTSPGTGTGLTERNASTPNGDFELDRRNGRIRFFSGGPGNVTGSAANDVLVTWQSAIVANPAAVGKSSAFALDDSLESVAALANSGYTGRLRFIGVNPVNANHPYEWTFHSVKLRPDGDLSLISDDFQQIQLAGTVEAASVTPYGLSRYMDLVTRRSYAT
jgi:hypothetical protein